MINFLKPIRFVSGLLLMPILLFAQKKELVEIVKSGGQKKIDVMIGGKLFTSLLYPDSLEKPVLYPVVASNGIVVTRGFPINNQPGDPTDHPHHVGVWFTFENVNGLDFWNNSYAIPAEKKNAYGWIRTDKVYQMAGGAKGVISYHANWTNQQRKVLLEENTHLEFSGTKGERIIDRLTILKADTNVTFTDAKDGMYGLRLAHALQIPTLKDQEFKDGKGNVTVVKGGSDKIANGNYITSEGKIGDDAWSSRGRWCKVYAKMGKDSVSVTIIDHPDNPNYPTFWHARGYGLFAANPLGEKIFTNGKSAKNLQLKKGESVIFRYRIVIDNGAKTPTPAELNSMADEYAREK
ncbi:MAG: PmoA family protein [Ginsengibacter sp.]